MVSCRQCNTHNSLDSVFCKKCGSTILDEDRAIAAEKLSFMIADGNKLFADGRTDDAMMVAETAVASDPSSSAALSLKGMCYERKGQLAEALECFEQVVLLNPDSTLDKLKVNDLKNMMVAEKFEVKQTPNRRVAAVSAIAAMALVISIGAMVARANAAQEPNNTKVVAMNEPNSDVQTFGDIATKSTANPQSNTTQTSTQEPATQPVDNPGVPNGYSNQPNNRDAREPIRIPAYTRSQLPAPDGNGNSNVFDNTTIRPVNPNVSGAIGGGVSTPPQQGSKGPDPDPGDLGSAGTDQGANSGKTAEGPKNDPGIIEIEVSKGNKTSGGSSGSEGGSSSNGRQALSAAARSQFMQGNYGAAANSYERSLRMGADPGSTNQRLGQCYAHLGRTSDAIAAYSRAASAFEKSGNVQAKEACQQAIKVLGG